MLYEKPHSQHVTIVRLYIKYFDQSEANDTEAYNIISYHVHLALTFTPGLQSVMLVEVNVLGVEFLFVLNEIHSYLVTSLFYICKELISEVGEAIFVTGHLYLFLFSDFQLGCGNYPDKNSELQSYSHYYIII